MDLSAFTRSDWIAIAALVVAFGAAYYTARNFHLSARKESREAAANDPIVEYEGWPGAPHTDPWHCYRITVRNRFDHAIFVDEICLIGPKKAEIAAVNTSRSINADGSDAYRTEILRCPDKNFPVGYARVGPAGESNSEVNFDVYLRPLSREAEFSVRLNLSARLASSLRFPMMLKIKVPADTTSAKIDSHSEG